MLLGWDEPLFQRPGHVEEVMGASRGGRLRPLLAVIRVSEIGTRAWTHVPVRPGRQRNAETQLHRSRCQFRDAVLGAVFVSGDDEAGYAVVGDHLSLLVLLGEHRVHPLQCPLGDARDLTQPGRAGEEDYVRSEYSLPDPWPVISVALI